MPIISFPGGSGGNWLLKLINNQLLPSNPVNFHSHEIGLQPSKTQNQRIDIVHELDPTKFDYLLSGKSYFNFYLNVIYKTFHHELDIFCQTDYKTHFLECVNTAKFLCKFDQIYDRVFFNYDDLIDSPNNFYAQLYKFQIDNSCSPTSKKDFLIKRNTYINTCVNPSLIKGNFDDMFWVCFIIGQLMNLDLVPTSFLISEYQNQDKCKQFALDNYQYCKLTKIHDIDTSVFMPNLL
jgi:hypothetical protein